MNREDLIYLEHQIAAAKKQLTELEKEYREKLVKYLEENPVDRKTQLDLIQFIQDGGSICCSAGAQALECYSLDLYWQRLLNSWAYENLSCGEPRRSMKACQNAQELEEAFKSGRFAEWSSEFY